MQEGEIVQQGAKDGELGLEGGELVLADRGAVGGVEGVAGWEGGGQTVGGRGGA